MVNRWYVAQTQQGSEKLAVIHLRKQRFEAYAPVVAQQRLVRGLKVMTETPLFGPYIFVELDLEEDRWRSVNGTRGVVRLLPAGSEEPMAVPGGFVEALRGRIESGEFNLEEGDTWLKSLVVGDNVTVASGGMVDRVGRFLGRDRGRVVVLMQLLSREIEVRIPVHQIRGT